MNIDHQRIVLTGAASGIGRALLRRLAGRDVELLCVDVAADALDAACADITRPVARIRSFVCDVGDHRAIDALFEHAQCVQGGVSLFIANAGIGSYGPLGRPDWATLEHLYRVNVLSPIYAAEKMQVLNAGRAYGVVMTASAMSFVALPGWAAYASTKAALHRFAEAYRHELAPDVLLSLVYPIATRSAFFTAAQDAPVPFLTQSPDDVADAILCGIARDAPEIHPSRLFRVAWALNGWLPVAPLLRALQGRVLRRWCATARPGSSPLPSD
ncbi:MAG: SDR family NAD(P)-dependent oxidoreductase [Gammaproteobacteria bacterium]